MTDERTSEELAYQAANIAAGFGDPYAEQAAPERCDVHGGRSLAACDHPAPTPVADALTEVNRVQAEGAHMTVGLAYAVTAELPALRKLADAVRSHGIGAELGQLRDVRTALAEVDQAARELDAARDAGEDDDAAESYRLDALLTLADAVRGRLPQPAEPRAFVPPF